MKNVSVNSQKLLLGLIIALLVTTAVQTTALVYISTNIGAVSAGTTTINSASALPDMAGGC